MYSRILLFLGLVVMTLGACSKSDDDNNNNNNNNNGACNGKNLCFKVDGTQFSGDATWRELPGNRYRIIWEDTTGGYKNVEIDFYGTLAVQTYQVVDSSHTSGEADFQYYNSDGNNTNIEGVSGAMIITSVANDQISGSFTLTARSATSNNIQVTEGNFVNVPKQ